jgi:hypothetical protein
VSVPVTATDVRVLLAETMAEVRNRRLDPRIASTMAYVAGALLKALETEDLESRIDELERNDAGVKQKDRD